MIDLSKKRAEMAKRRSGESVSIEFALTDDRMAAYISAYEIKPGEEELLSVEIMKRELKKAGYDGKLDLDAANFAIKRLKEGKSILNVALVRGEYPQEPENGRIFSQGNLKYPVVPGLVFGKLIPATKGRPGKTIDGEVITPKSDLKPTPLTITEASGCTLEKETGELRSRRYGLVKIKDNTIVVEPLIEVAPDYMSITAKFYGFDCFGSHIALRHVEHSLKELNITRPVQHVAGETALKKARETKKPQEAVIVKGTEPIPGKDGWFEYAGEDVNKVGTVLKGDRVDYRERGVHPMVKPGQIIGKIHPPVEGIAGEDVYGRLTPPPDGSQLKIIPDESVEMLEDGISYKAKATGVVDLKDGVLSVCDILVTKGDVDYSTGNIRLETGSVHVNGNIREGFTVEVPDHILVRQTIEDALVLAGRDIEVSGGIVMGGRGQVKCKGCITAHFAANAHIECAGDLSIKSELSNSKVRAKGMVLAVSGKGVIQGGSIASYTGVEANEIGSDIGVKTVVSIISEPPDTKHLVEKREALRGSLLKINKSIGEEPDDIILAATAEDKKEMMQQVLLVRAQTKMKLKNIRRSLSAELSAYFNALEKRSIKVRRVAYPGLVIRIGGKSLQLEKPLNRVRFYFDATKKEIVAGDL
jgi:hypothetical protein